MSQRDMWKMLHLLNNTPRPHLTTQELAQAGVDCYNDKLMALADNGAVIKNDGTEKWTLSPSARDVLNNCTVAMRGPGAAEVQVDRESVFVVMPFIDTDAIWHDYIEAAINDAGLRPMRGDITLRTGNLRDNVWKGILECGCVVAELSRENPNVYYELGLAHASGRDTFVLVQTNVDLPADLKGTHYVEYDPADLAAAKADLQLKLQDWRDDAAVQVAGTEALFA